MTERVYEGMREVKRYQQHPPNELTLIRVRSRESIGVSCTVMLKQAWVEIVVT